ncbi:hypothetical protein [Catenulispora rubra]|uniref:hypothetical protein n=1 Tax=Catenulispora rubra TaxID=280293 RepID=UPI001891F704|nr:hypothetical protein [Catenulispora rubra]
MAEPSIAPEACAAGPAAVDEAVAERSIGRAVAEIGAGLAARAVRATRRIGAAERWIGPRGADEPAAEVAAELCAAPPGKPAGESSLAGTVGGSAAGRFAETLEPAEVAGSLVGPDVVAARWIGLAGADKPAAEVAPAAGLCGARPVELAGEPSLAPGKEPGGGSDAGRFAEALEPAEVAGPPVGPDVVDERWIGLAAAPVGSAGVLGELDAERWIGLEPACEPAMVEPEFGRAAAARWIGPGAMPVGPELGEAVRWIGPGAMPVGPELGKAVRWIGPGAMPVGPELGKAVRWIGPRLGCEPAAVEPELGEGVAERSIGLVEARWIELVPACVPSAELAEVAPVGEADIEGCIASPVAVGRL